MLKIVEGVYRHGDVELAEAPQDFDESCILVTFLPGEKAQSLSDYGIGEVQAADLHARLRSFEEDRNRPDMDGYDTL